ncbi:hypothetical protein LTR12_011795 [Friedmanniomyces endolithicus]|nr:hypothetical protein LTR12_011795 [Friedmanniomyces endolithicus]
MGSSGEDDKSSRSEENAEDPEENASIEDDGEDLEESPRSEFDGEDLEESRDIEDDGDDLERTTTGRLSRSRKAIAARREEMWCEEIKELTAAVLEEPKSIITTAIERCKPLLAVQQLTPDDQDDLFQALAQSTNADIIVELPKEDLVWYVEELLLEVKQSPRAALNRCCKLAAFNELQPAERNLLYAAVMQPPRAKAIAALSDTDLAAFLKELLSSLKQAAAAAAKSWIQHQHQYLRTSSTLRTSSSLRASSDLRTLRASSISNTPSSLRALCTSNTFSTLRFSSPSSTLRTIPVREDRVKLYTVVAQSPMPDLIVALPEQDLAPHVDTFVSWAKQAPQEAILPPASKGGESKSDLSGTARVAITRCSNLAAVRALSRLDHVHLITAVAQPPHSGLVAALSDTDVEEYIKALLNSLKQAPAARETFAGGPPRLSKGGSTATAAAVQAAAIAPIPEGRAGVGAAVLPLPSAMSQGGRPSPSLLGYGWTAQPWAKELTDYLWGQFYKDMACGTGRAGSLGAPAVEAGAVSWRAA